MQQISAAKLKQIAEAGTILADDGGFVRAVRDGDGRIWKQFRRKSLPSTAAIRPYARRFIRSAQRLQQRGINTVTVREMHQVRETGRHVVVYDEMPGRTLRAALETDGVQRASEFAAYLALLHERGIYFRSMHLDNVLLLDTGEFALIDVTHVTFSRRQQSPWRRARNFKPVTSYARDRDLLEQFGRRRFLEEYLGAAQLDAARRRRFLKHLMRLNAFFSDAAKEISNDRSPMRASATSGGKMVSP